MNPPGYWQFESTGRLRPVIVAYLKNQELSSEQIGLMRQYLRQWVDSEVWDQNPHMTPKDKGILFALRTSVMDLTSRSQIDHWLAVALDFGIDPL